MVCILLNKKIKLFYCFKVRNDTRYCNSCRTFCCGGRGEEVQIESTFCCGLCKRGRACLTCVPSFCPEVCCPCLAKVCEAMLFL